MTRRRHLQSLLALFFAAAPCAVATGQEAAGRAEAPAVAAPEPQRKPRPARRRGRARQAGAGAQQQQQAAPPFDTSATQLEAAPVPNRDLEAPRAPGTGTDRARLSPSVIHRPLPSQGMAAEGAQNIQEERLFFPAPGARLNVPFSY